MSRQDHKCNDATRNLQDMIQEYYIVRIGNEIKTARTYRSNCAMKVSTTYSLAWYRCNGRIVIVLYRWFSEIQEPSVSLYIIIARSPILSLIIWYLDIRILYSFSAFVYPMKIQLSFFMAYFMVVRVFKPLFPGSFLTLSWRYWFRIWAALSCSRSLASSVSDSRFPAFLAVYYLYLAYRKENGRLRIVPHLQNCHLTQTFYLSRVFVITSWQSINFMTSDICYRLWFLSKDIFRIIVGTAIWTSTDI